MLKYDGKISSSSPKIPLHLGLRHQQCSLFVLLRKQVQIVPEQLVFQGFEHQLLHEPTDGLFLAVVPPASMADRISNLIPELRARHGLRGEPLSPRRLHVTLHYLGSYNGLPRKLMETVCAAAPAVSMPPFEISFDRALSFTSRKKARPFVLRAGGDVIPLLGLHRAVGEAITRAGLGRWVTRHFTPHMTLLYDRRLVDEHPIESLGWTVTDFVFVHSLVGQGVHNHLARWPLQR
jgi:2'-5' RNA ligase